MAPDLHSLLSRLLLLRDLMRDFGGYGPAVDEMQRCRVLWLATMRRPLKGPKSQGAPCGSWELRPTYCLLDAVDLRFCTSGTAVQSELKPGPPNCPDQRPMVLFVPLLCESVGGRYIRLDTQKHNGTPQSTVFIHRSQQMFVSERICRLGQALHLFRTVLLAVPHRALEPVSLQKMSALSSLPMYQTQIICSGDNACELSYLWCFACSPRFSLC